MLRIENKVIHVVDNAIDPGLVEELFQWAVASSAFGWRYGDVADAKYSLNPFWGATVVSEPRHGTEDPAVIEDAHPLAQRVWQRLERGLKPFSFLIRDVYVNGQTYGMENALHTDNPSEDEGWYTVLVYLNPKWHIDYGGETMFYNAARTDVIFAVVPKPGRIVFFDARHRHWARPPTRNTQDLRVTMAFHLTRAPESPVP
jgi:SM-20-related protein